MGARLRCCWRPFDHLTRYWKVALCHGRGCGLDDFLGGGVGRGAVLVDTKVFIRAIKLLNGLILRHLRSVRPRRREQVDAAFAAERHGLHKHGRHGVAAALAPATREKLALVLDIRLHERVGIVGCVIWLWFCLTGWARWFRLRQG